MSIAFTSLAAEREIGSHCYLLELGEHRIALDAGTHPKRDGLDTLPDISALDYDTLDAILLTHAHLDHSGALPVLSREHPRARVLMSEATRHLTDAMLHNSVNVMTSKRDEKDIPEYPLYGHRELERQFATWEAAPVGRPFPIVEGSDLRCEFYHAGHIMGAVSALLDYEGHRVLYTGDLHFEKQTLAHGADLPTSGVDTVVVETTRGATVRPADYTRESEVARLASHINAILDRGGAVLIPVFAMGKTQELLVTLHDLKGAGVIPNAPVHIGGLSTKMTKIYDSLANRVHRQRPGFRILEEVDIMLSTSRKRTRQIEFNPGSIYALSSGMMAPRTVSNVFAKKLLEDPRSGILFVGYADPASPAGHILAAEPGDPIQLDENGPALSLRCSVEKFDFSGHATRESILDYLTTLKARNIVLVHGDAEALSWFEGKLAQALPDSRVLVPEPGTRYTLE